MSKNKPTKKVKKYRYYLQPTQVDWDLLSHKRAKKYLNKDIFIKKCLKFTLKREKAISFPDLSSGEEAADKYAEKILPECRQRYGKSFEIDVVRMKRPKKD